MTGGTVKTEQIAGTPFRFALVGLTCALVHNAIMIGLDRVGMHYAASSVVSFLVVVVLGYGLHVRYTFGVAPVSGAFWRYTLGMAANYPLSLVLLFVLCDLVQLPVAIAAPVATVMLFGWNFVASRWALIRPAAKPAISQPPGPT